MLGKNQQDKNDGLLQAHEIFPLNLNADLVTLSACFSAAGEIDSNILRDLCNGECFNPSDERKNIVRIEVIRIRPQTYPEEPIEALIEDPWRVFQCDPSQEGCEVEFEDPNYLDANREIILLRSSYSRSFSNNWSSKPIL